MGSGIGSSSRKAWKLRILARQWPIQLAKAQHRSYQTYQQLGVFPLNEVQDLVQHTVVYSVSLQIVLTRQSGSILTRVLSASAGDLLTEDPFIILKNIFMKNILLLFSLPCGNKTRSGRSYTWSASRDYRSRGSLSTLPTQISRRYVLKYSSSVASLSLPMQYTLCMMLIPECSHTD